LRASRPDAIVRHLGELREMLEQHGFQWPPAGTTPEEDSNPGP
jgi:hypothetical protein